ncbi:CxC2 domain-containing protein [Mycena sanguinolenta]|uniref:CxC2 domain-containing protein n=1 Tax=Mycena sanguinolenta TaxID=230812 RepID=A0A8H7CM20_9AGAR|nr:CxC2 domain-containing protein [Mycena sanguinolenta]
MRRASTKEKWDKNIYSLGSFGHSLTTPSSTAPPVARTGHLSADRRRADIRVISLEQETSAPISGGYSTTDLGHDQDDNWLDLPDESTSAPTGSTSKKRKRKWYATTDEALRYWANNYRDAYLRVLVIREGLMGEELSCRCGQDARFRCRECYGVQMYCQDCMVEAHRLHPLCRIEVWNGAFFERRGLRRLGLRIQLGHPDNQPCPRVHPGGDKFVVIVTNGFHQVAVDFRQCRRSSGLARWEQLLRYGWYPSTPDHPKSAITISALKFFHAVSLQGKTTVYYFFHALARITDNTGGGSSAFQRRYKLALRVVRQWRNLRALKRGGLGNDPDRCASETRDGELAVECLACPKPGVNLLPDWKNTPLDKRFLYMIFLAIDACFRLKRKKISSWAADPSLQDGWAYFVPSAAYTDFVKTLGEQKEMSTCTGLAALDHANTKYPKGYAATGCGMITCGRHEIVSKNGVGNLQNGEKYGNIDYIVASAWQHLCALLFFPLSYDIMCQWSKHLQDRLSKLPPALRFQLATFFVKFVIPKLHILGHLRDCQENFSLLYTLGAGQADMEGIERIWSSSGLMGASTREMGPGSHQDTLDDFWHFWNWNKVVGMGTTLRKRFLNATKELSVQKSWLDKFGQARHDEIAAWKKAVDDFEAFVVDEEAEPRVEPPANPYQLPQSGVTLREIELELMRQEQERERMSPVAPDAREETMTEYLMLGLGIEAQQRQLAADLLNNRSPTTKDLTDFVTRRTRRAATAVDADALEAERTPLFLLSGLSPHESVPPLSVPELAATEARLRDAQCNLPWPQQDKVDSAARTYRNARAARIALNHVAGTSTWQELQKDDLRLPEDEEEAKRRQQHAMKGKRQHAAQLNADGEVCGMPGMGEKSCLTSWIWLAAGAMDGVIGEEMRACIRVEWCKAYARVKRWREEVLLLQEEMVRCLRTLKWQAKTWDQRAAPSYYQGKIVYSPVHLQGATAFAARQVASRRLGVLSESSAREEQEDFTEDGLSDDGSEDSGGVSIGEVTAEGAPTNGKLEDEQTEREIRGDDEVHSEEGDDGGGTGMDLEDVTTALYLGKDYNYQVLLQKAVLEEERFGALVPCFPFFAGDGPNVTPQHPSELSDEDSDNGGMIVDETSYSAPPSNVVVVHGVDPQYSALLFRNLAADMLSQNHARPESILNAQGMIWVHFPTTTEGLRAFGSLPSLSDGVTVSFQSEEAFVDAARYTQDCWTLETTDEDLPIYCENPTVLLAVENPPFQPLQRRQLSPFNLHAPRHRQITRWKRLRS